MCMINDGLPGAWNLDFYVDTALQQAGHLVLNNPIKINLKQGRVLRHNSTTNQITINLIRRNQHKQHAFITLANQVV